MDIVHLHVLLLQTIEEWWLHWLRLWYDNDINKTIKRTCFNLNEASICKHVYATLLCYFSLLYVSVIFDLVTVYVYTKVSSFVFDRVTVYVCTRYHMLCLILSLSMFVQGITFCVWSCHCLCLYKVSPVVFDRVTVSVCTMYRLLCLIVSLSLFVQGITCCVW